MLLSSGLGKYFLSLFGMQFSGWQTIVVFNLTMYAVFLSKMVTLIYIPNGMGKEFPGSNIARSEHFINTVVWLAR